MSQLDTNWGLWQKELARGFSQPAPLLAALGLPPDLAGGSDEAQRQFPMRVPRGFVRRMRPRDPWDPLLLQVLPQAAETAPQPGYGEDPVGESTASPVPGVLHKYHGRALLTVTGACAVHCRYCFRRHFPYSEHGTEPARQEALAYLERSEQIREVILSGGDPLSLPDEQLAPLAERLAGLAHLERLRIHTRLPVVLPERVDDPLLAWMAACRLQTIVVVHANHPHEIDASVAAASGRLREVGAVLLNQTVLLRGINDRAETLVELSERLFAAGILPYYLHQLDPVRGAAHFEVESSRALEIDERLRTQLPGYLVPRLVREVTGAPAKLPLFYRS